jgi:sortase A
VIRVRKPAPPPKPQTAASQIASWMLLIASGLAIWLAFYGLVFSGLVEQHAQHNLYNSFRTKLAENTAPVGGAVKEGTAVVLLDAPAGGLHSLVVVEGTTSSDLRNGPGLYPGSPLPGQPGLSIILGRATTFGGPFSTITAMLPGDTITATTGEGVFTFVVRDVRRSGDPVPTTLPSGTGQLMLVTAEADGWRSRWAPTESVYVDAVLKGATQPAPNGSSPTQPADKPMHGQTNAMYPMVLWLVLLFAVSIGLVWSAMRWGKWQTWLIGTPIAIAVLWQASATLWSVFPNLL